MSSFRRGQQQQGGDDKSVGLLDVELQGASDENNLNFDPEDAQSLHLASPTSLTQVGGSASTRNVKASEAPHVHPRNMSSGQYWKTLLGTLGPGIMVCLADTDGPCLLTAATSGKQFGYSLVMVQILLIPVLYWAQDLTVRLAVVTGKGLTEQLREVCGFAVSCVAAVILVFTCVAAVISEMSSIAQVGQLWGTDTVASWHVFGRDGKDNIDDARWVCQIVTVIILFFFLLGTVFSGSHRQVEILGVAFGCFQLIFLPIMFLLPIKWGEVGKGLITTDFTDSNWTSLVAAGIGAVIMPWMLYYQQSAVANKKMHVSHLHFEKIDTAFGSILTQLVMISMVIAMGATIYVPRNEGKNMQDVSEIVDALTPYLGAFEAKCAVSFGIVGASLVAAIVVSVAPAWSLCELTGRERSLNMPFNEAKDFYITFIGLLILSAVVTMIPGVGDSVVLNVQVEILNAVLMPFVVGFLTFLACKEGVLPENHRVKGWYKWMLITVFFICSAFSWYGAYETVDDWLHPKKDSSGRLLRELRPRKRRILGAVRIKYFDPEHPTNAQILAEGGLGSTAAVGGM